MWKITKQFEFCYGHRVHNQVLNSEYSLDNACICRHLHGHQGTLIVTLEGEELNNSMVTDFKHLNWLKKFIDDTLDHKFIIDINDPFTKSLIESVTGPTYHITPIHVQTLQIYSNVYYYGVLPLEDFQKEIIEGLILVDFVPTSERLAEWLLKICNHKMSNLGIKTTSVKFCETPKTSAEYYG